MADNGGKNGDTLSILTLGDGDFTFSLDLAQYYSFYLQDIEAGSCSRHISIDATSFDSLDALHNKYKDIDSILHKIFSISTTIENRPDGSHCSEDCCSDRTAKKNKAEKGNFGWPNDFQPRLFVSIHHNVNAVIFPSQHDDDLGRSALDAAGYHHAIFNHPHLGTEDTKLHSMFMSHFFHSCDNHWLRRPNGVLHLTLALGQCERWHVIPLAKEQGLKLLRRKRFQPPLAAIGAGRGHYVLRRHQSGKSFSTRMQGSETLIFGREHAWGSDSTDFTSFELPWYGDDGARSQDQGQRSKEKVSTSTNTSVTYFKEIKCQYCDKTFAEERSKKNHLMSVHLDSSGTIVANTAAQLYHCEFCPGRSFPSESGLEYHVRARHTLHTDNIKPDWCMPNGDGLKVCAEVKIRSDVDQLQTVPTQGQCEICKVFYSESFGQREHLKQFRPVTKKTDTQGKLPFQCQKCQKGFWENRARLQHENFCVAQKRSS